MSEQPVFREGALHVCVRKCATCIYRPGNLMHLEPGRKDAMEAEAVANESVIPCHKTLGDTPAICRGYWDTQRRNVPALRLAVALDIMKMQDPDMETIDEH